MKNYEDIRNAIIGSNLSVQELRDLNAMIVTSLNVRHKIERDLKNKSAKSSLKVGMEVNTNHARVYGQTFVVTDIRRSKASVRLKTDAFVSYNVSLSMLQPI